MKYLQDKGTICMYYTVMFYTLCKYAHIMYLLFTVLYIWKTVCIIKLNENLNQLCNRKYFILNLLIGYIIIIKTHFFNYYRPNYLIIHSDTLLHDLLCLFFFEMKQITAQ